MEQRIADIDAKKKELYKEHARYKYQYEKDVDISEADLPVIDDILSESDVAVTDSSITEILHEETDMIVEEVYYDINELEIVELPYEPANKLIEAIVEGEANLQTVEALDMPKKRCEALTDKQKVEWLGIAGCSVREAIQRFISKLDSIGVVYQYSADMLDEFIRLEAVSKDKKSEQREEADIILQRDYENKGKSR